MIFTRTAVLIDHGSKPTSYLRLFPAQLLKAGQCTVSGARSFDRDI
jgi:hypothetical protein